jgi:Fur family ferric uptake transcriptional regulator
LLLQFIALGIVMSHQNLDLATLLHKNGYRMTPQRQLVLDAVCEIDGHATPDQIYEIVQEKTPAINKVTVYRVLKFLLEMGLLTATFSADGRQKYELAGLNNHHHLVCRKCGIDVEFFDQGFSALVRSLQDTYAFKVESNHITLTGLCDLCRRKT